ncbi:hypothetical protein C7N43_11755 [Sphingobacteriales bacterium UPWRP_1]|nr:hypothetical protein B6N25_13515 [Sphingobacteriales bacterium TSM_CSS]PSJ76803.1 hypothetical protein C7N43_11755 [Sphingobacteriales bacterium UPWRP_1]
MKSALPAPVTLFAKVVAILFFMVFVFSACEKDDVTPPDNNDTINNPIDTTQHNDTLVFDPLPACNPNYLPVVMMHGFLASGDTYAPQVMRFTSNGYCEDRLFTFDWNSIAGGDNVPVLDAFVDEVLSETGADKVELVGHSAGGGLGYSYLSDAARAAKVAHYVHIGSSAQSGPAGPAGEVPTLNIWSPDDEIASGADIPGATNVQVPGADHYQVATGPQSFAAMYTFFTGNAPQTTAITPQARFNVGGKAVTLGENAPLNGATVTVFELNPQTGWRLNEQPDYTFVTNEKGFWGSFMPKPQTPYEFYIVSANPNDRPIHYYREGFTHSNPYIYLRTLPPPGSIAGILLAGLPKDDDQTVMAIFASAQAVINGRDELFLDGTELSTPALAPPAETAIAFFAYDANNNNATDNTSIGLFNFAPFLSGVDIFMPAATPGSIPVTFNNRTMYVRNWPSASDGVIVTVFD